MTLTLIDQIVLVGVVALFLIIYRSSPHHRAKLPPGPHGIPIFGNFLQVPRSNAHLKHLEWAHQYGAILYLRLFREDVVLLTSLEAANALIDKRSYNYSDRPRQVMAGELIGWNRALAIAPAGPRHRAHRKLINSILSITAVKRLWPVQESSAHRFIEELFDAGVSSSAPQDDFLEVLRLRVAKSVVGMVFGNPSEKEGDEGMTQRDVDQYIHDADEAQAVFGKTTVPYAYLVDSIPWLRHIPDIFPFTGFQREAQESRRRLEEVTYEPYFKTRERIISGISQASYVDAALSTRSHPSPEEEDSIAWTGLSAYTAGSDTTLASLTSVFLLAALHPDLQELVHKELDNVIGTDRMPCLEDKANLPYTTAFIEECMRRVPVAPFGVPHKALEEDVYNGYTIPKGATIITSIWCMAHDSNIYSNPDTFDPSRFLPSAGISTILVPLFTAKVNSHLATFHLALVEADQIERICPGMHLANSGVWIYTASFLWAYRISLPTDSKAKNIDDFEFIDGLVRYPKAFKAKIRLRHTSTEQVLRGRGIAHTKL